MLLSFSKYSGSGNDFILVDNREQLFPHENKGQIVRLCHRKHGIGADGLILLEHSSKADYKMRIFNADGGEAELCGNGIRCLFLFLNDLGLPNLNYKIETMESVITGKNNKDFIDISMPEPHDVRPNISLNIDNIPLVLHHINTGVPHAVIFVDDLESDHWMKLAPQIRHHAIFAPHGTNVNFIKIDPSGVVNIRTYERGVEGETLACGTGAIAAALTASTLYCVKSPVKVKPRSNESLKIGFKLVNDKPEQVTMSGPANFIFKGVLDLRKDI